MRIIRTLPGTRHIRVPVLRSLRWNDNVEPLATPNFTVRTIDLTPRIAPDGVLCWASYDRETDTFFIGDVVEQDHL